MKGILIFLAGVAAGAVATGIVLKNEYEKRIQNEVNELRDFYRNRQQSDEIQGDTESDTAQDSDDESEPEDDTNAYEEALKNYTKEGEKTVTEPYVISPDEYGEIDDYKLRSLVYYADDVLADDKGYHINNRDELIGEDSLEHFGEYEEDSVFVRNPALKCDFEILLDLRTYSAAMKNTPHAKEE